MKGSCPHRPHVVAGYVPGMPIVHDVSIDVAHGEIVTIIGPNGAGKSTFLKALAGLVLLEGGRSSAVGGDISGLPAHRMVKSGARFCPPDGQCVYRPQHSRKPHASGGHTLVGAALQVRLPEPTTSFRCWPSDASRTAGSCPEDNARCWRSPVP